MATKKKPAAKKKTARKSTKPARKPAKSTAVRKQSPAAARAKPRRPARRKPESIRIGAAMPSFTVNDLSRSLAWYRDVLGFVVDQEWKQDGVVRGVSLKAGRTEFMIGQDDFAKGRDRHKGVGFRLYCSTMQDVDELAAGVESRGGTLDSRPQDQPWGTRDFTVTDPDGFKLTIGKDK